MRQTLSQKNAELELALSKSHEQLYEKQAEVRTLELKLKDMQGWIDRCDTLQEQVLKIPVLEKELKSLKDMQSYYQKQEAEANAEVEQAHAALDGIEGAPAREYEQEYGKGKRKIVTRLAGAMLSIARGVK